MYIVRVAVENYRNFSSLVVDQWPTPAVLTGENNAGKSNLLHALRLVLDDELPDRQRNLQASDVWDGHPGGLEAGVTVRISVDLAGFDGEEYVKAVLGDYLITADPPVARLTYIWEPNELIPAMQPGVPMRPSTYKRSDYQWRLVGGTDDRPVDIRRVRNYLGFKVLPAMRDAEEELYGRRRSVLRNLVEDNPPTREHLEQASTDIGVVMDTLGKDPAIDALQTQIRERTLRLVGSALPVTPTFGFAGNGPDQVLAALRIFMDEERQRGVSETSLGTANVLYIAVLLHHLEQQRKAVQRAATVLAVEEPEAHLHVQTQRRLFGSLLRDEPTLLLTTHSPNIAAVTPLESVVLVRRIDANTSGVWTTQAAGLSDQQRADVERYLDATRAELLFARFVILVEGDAELYVLPALACAVGFDLDASCISVVSVQGTDFAPYTRLLSPQCLAIPHLVVTDGDVTWVKGVRREPGLVRAARLLEESEERRSELLAQLKPDAPDAEGSEDDEDDEDDDIDDGDAVGPAVGEADAAPAVDRRAVVEELAGHGLHVGVRTLEPDLAMCFPQQFQAAFEDLVPGELRRKRFAGYLADLNEKNAASLVRAIEAIGKGRFAQRLAAHLKVVDAQEVLAHLGAGDQPGLYLLRALDAASMMTRGEPLGGPAAPTAAAVRP